MLLYSPTSSFFIYISFFLFYFNFIIFIFIPPLLFFFFFFLNDPATPDISPLPLHASLPICSLSRLLSFLQYHFAWSGGKLRCVGCHQSANRHSAGVSTHCLSQRGRGIWRFCRLHLPTDAMEQPTDSVRERHLRRSTVCGFDNLGNARQIELRLGAILSYQEIEPRRCV